MLQKKSKPPEVMTWAKASLVLVVAAVFDLVRLFFEQFWFFGPALAGVYCVDKVSGVIGTTVGAMVCGAGATAVGYFGAPALTAFGIVMAIAVGFFGWLTVGLMLMMTNARIFKENEGHALWFVASLAVSEVPIIGSLPALTGTLVKMYSAQIKKDKESMKKYEAEQAALQQQERNQRMAELMQAQAAQLEQANEQEEEELEEEIPDEMPEAS